MNADLDHLVALDTIDRELDQLDLTAKQAREAQAAAAAERDAQRAAAAKHEAERLASVGRQKAAESRIKGHRDRMRSAKQALETGVGNYQVAERQIEEYTRLLDADETSVLEELDAQDTLAARKAEAEKLATQAAERLALLEGRQPELEATSQARRTELHTTRAAHLAQLVVELQNRYNALRSRGKRAVAKIVDGACSACSQHVQDQQRIEVTRGRLEACRGCHRWLTTV